MTYVATLSRETPYTHKSSYIFELWSSESQDGIMKLVERTTHRKQSTALAKAKSVAEEHSAILIDRSEW